MIRFRAVVYVPRVIEVDAVDGAAAKVMAHTKAALMTDRGALAYENTAPLVHLLEPLRELDADKRLA